MNNNTPHASDCHAHHEGLLHKRQDSIDKPMPSDLLLAEAIGLLDRWRRNVSEERSTKTDYATGVDDNVWADTRAFLGKVK